MAGDKTISRILIANRGEIAVRIIRAIRDLGLESVAIYSDADKDSLHVRMADYAVNIPGISSSDTYLNIPAIIEAVETTSADAVHPGYGFLSESSQFADAVCKAGVKFIGPSVKSMRLLGDKIQAREMAIKNDIPIVPGIEYPLNSVEDLKREAQRIGYPMILKAAAGGGGRGMRIVRCDEDLQDSFDACRREAQAYFANPDVFCERFIENPRHIEFQVLFDSHGNGVHLFERDCSVQRRNQKLFEEAPSSYLNPEQRKRLGDIAVRVAASAGYENAGTVEFICESPDKAYFMEMNTRIQVEHPVTELISGVDLIVEQINVAQGKKLPFKQDDLKINGWSMEARINAEIAEKDFMPSPGEIRRLRFPSGPHVRIDSHLYQGYKIPEAYDSMVAKLIVWGRDREEALRRMRRSLSDMEVIGVPTTASFHEALLSNNKFCSGNFSTNLIVEEWENILSAMNNNETITSDVAAALSAVLTLSQQGCLPNHPTHDYRQTWLQKARLEMNRFN
ncbi:MAG: acetyl-CoA carboxylase biotin carboxylase subunit [Bdellovibrionota bacterium]